MGQIPAWHKGKLKYCDISGYWYGEREGKLFKRRGIWVDRVNYDTVTDEERTEALKRRANR